MARLSRTEASNSLDRSLHGCRLARSSTPVTLCRLWDQRGPSAIEAAATRLPERGDDPKLVRRRMDDGDLGLERVPAAGLAKRKLERSPR